MHCQPPAGLVPCNILQVAARACEDLADKIIGRGHSDSAIEREVALRAAARRLRDVVDRARTTTALRVHSVIVHDRDDGVFLFVEHEDAARFNDAVQRAGGDTTMTEEPVSFTSGAEDLIAAELEFLDEEHDTDA